MAKMIKRGELMMVKLHDGTVQEAKIRHIGPEHVDEKGVGWCMIHLHLTSNEKSVFYATKSQFVEDGNGQA